MELTLELLIDTIEKAIKNGKTPDRFVIRGDKLNEYTNTDEFDDDTLYYVTNSEIGEVLW